ncbi:hypothetical protein H4R34_005056 [Dimargaris verticillata]|uniref:F-box domain-containing protein n=1 Tax=Dimargaris verticillata TaxID=2761393 RepID=A0A9W8E7I0_9FUNG|nr:hypothetical protein H4R34_005056 [Dimargaris verticillata]
MRYEITLLLLAAVAMAQPALPDTSESDAVVVGMEQLGLQENLSQNPLATLGNMSSEVLIGILGKAEPKNQRNILTTSRRIHKTITEMWRNVPKEIKAQYLQDPTVSNEDKLRYQSLQQADPSAAQAQLNDYTWRRLQYRWDHGLLPSTGDIISQTQVTVDVVLDALKDGLDRAVF